MQADFPIYGKILSYKVLLLLALRQNRPPEKQGRIEAMNFRVSTGLEGIEVFR
jgi:hypothetical protein